jgi:GntR family transcriptional regulator
MEPLVLSKVPSAMKLDPCPIAKYHRIELILADRISNGFYGDGTLPAERNLAKEFGVARITIRHALRRLEDQGLVGRQGRRGTTALHEDLELRRPRVLREHVDQFLDRGRLDQRKVISFGNTQASESVANLLGMPVGEKLLRVARLRSRAGSALTYTESYVPLAFAHTLDRKTLGKKALIQALEDAGIKIGSAQQTIQAGRSSPKIALALGISEGEPVLQLTRQVFDAQGTAVQLLFGWYRADHFEVEMHISRANDLTRVWIRQR